MRYYSDKTHKLYETAEALQEDEEKAENTEVRITELNSTIKDMEIKLKKLKQERDELVAYNTTNNFFKYIWN